MYPCCSSKVIGLVPVELCQHGRVAAILSMLVDLCWTVDVGTW